MPGTTPTLRLSPAVLTRVRGAWPRVVAAFESAWCAYPLLLLFQLKIVRGVWAYREVSGGDTAFYFRNAREWFTGGVVNIAWSPLYTAFYGSFLFLNPDPVWATFAHRVVIVLAAALLALAVFRRLLPPSVAWLCAAWWAALPVVFDTLYEVHLFAVIPVFVSWLLLASATGPWRRAAGLAVLAASAVLVRNELSVASAVLGVVLAWYEWRAVRSGRVRVVAVFGAYAVALAAAAGLCGLAYARSEVVYPELREAFDAKHRVNMAQVYAFGHKQRHPEWTRDHWTECYGLMEETFGQPRPSLREMVAANPRAVAGHFLWNVSLVPDGLQLLLFNRTSGSVHPDYFPPTDSRLNRVRPAALGLVVLAAWGFGLACLWRGRAWWGGGAPASRLAWAGVLAVAAVAPLVILTQRPRPSYLFALGAGLMAVTGLCAWAAATRWGLAGRLRAAAPVLAAVVILTTSGQYRAHTKHTRRPLVEAADRLRPHAGLIAPDVKLLTPDGVGGVAMYLTGRAQSFEELAPVLGRWPSGEPLAVCLTREGFSLAYLDEGALARLDAERPAESRAFLDGTAPGWVLVTGADTPGNRWRLYRRTE